MDAGEASYPVSETLAYRFVGGPLHNVHHRVVREHDCSVCVEAQVLDIMHDEVLGTITATKPRLVAYRRQRFRSAMGAVFYAFVDGRLHHGRMEVLALTEPPLTDVQLGRVDVQLAEFPIALMLKGWRLGCRHHGFALSPST
jgi:hypothetical protein